MAKVNTVTYRLIDLRKSPFRYVIQIKKWWGWSTLKSTKEKYSLDCESEADYWMKKNYPKVHLFKRSTVRK